jgi:hypothetical protein
MLDMLFVSSRFVIWKSINETMQVKKRKFIANTAKRYHSTAIFDFDLEPVLIKVQNKSHLKCGKQIT